MIDALDGSNENENRAVTLFARKLCGREKHILHIYTYIIYNSRLSRIDERKIEIIRRQYLQRFYENALTKIRLIRKINEICRGLLMTQIYRELTYRRVEPYQGDYIYYVTIKSPMKRRTSV